VTLWENGNKFIGRYIKGKRDGTGRMMYIDRKSEYIGDWHQDVYHGLGIIKTLQSEYRGEFEHGKMVNQHPHSLFKTFLEWTVHKIRFETT
jgi:hypothetical protein